jgi:hypothetical protein
MEYGFSILMFIFAGAILLYAGILALTKDYNMLPYRSRVSVKPKDPKRYAAGLAKVLALVALAPALGGLAALWRPMAGVAVLIGGAVLFIWIGTKMMKGIN